MAALRQMFGRQILSNLIEPFGGILGDLVKDIMLIKGLDAGVSEHELADAGILLRELGAHQTPQVMWLDIRQPDPHRVPLDDLPGTLAGEWFCREPAVGVLSTTVKASEDVGGIDGAGGEPCLDGGVGLPRQGGHRGTPSHSSRAPQQRSRDPAGGSCCA